MTEHSVEIIGTIAATCTTICFSFQCYKVFKSKSTKDISFLMYLVFIVGTVNWIIFGFFAQHPSIFYSNIITTTLALYILVAKIKYG